jgi:hypothetical protein
MTSTRAKTLIDKILAGADFGGTKENPNETWLVAGRLSNAGMEVFEVKKTYSHLLVKDLVDHKTLARLGIDCPFSLPADFLSFLAKRKAKGNYDSWQQVVEELVFVPYDEFSALAKEFGKESKRLTDTVNGTTVVSPLKRTNPPMQQFTYHGMRVLASLDPSRFFVLPFQDPIPFGCAVMEVNPAHTLKSLGVKETGYQNKDKGDDAQAEILREKIVQDLLKLKDKKAITCKDYPPLSIQKGLIHNFIKSHHALDALICCYTTAMFATAPNHFADPFDADSLDVLLEGWIYQPN